MELGHSTAFLGAFVASGVLAVVLAYLARITQFRMALHLWALGFALNAGRILIYSVAGITPANGFLFLLVEWSQLLQSLLLLLGVLDFVGRRLSLGRHVLPAVAATLPLTLLAVFVWSDGTTRVLPIYGLTALMLIGAGIEIVRSRDNANNAGSIFTAATLILWGFHKLDFVFLPSGFSSMAHVRFMLSAGFYTAAALGFSIVALGAFHRRMSRTLVEDEARFRKMFEDAPVGYQSLDENGRIVAVNRRWLDMLGYGENEVVGRDFGDFLLPSSRSKFPTRFAAFKESGVASGTEFELLRKDGRRIIGSFEGRISKFGEPGVLRTHCVLSDVTERREKEALVSRFGRIIDQAFNEIFVFDAATLRFIHANKGALANTGFSLEELRGMTPVDLKPGVTREAFEARLAPLRRGERESALFESRSRRKDGSVYDVETRVQLMADEVPPVFVAVVQDISARKAAEAALKASEGLMRGLMDHSPASISVKDTAGRYMFVNHEFERRYDCVAADVIGKRIDEFLPKDHADDVARRERRALDEGRTIQDEIALELPTGRRFLLSAKFPVFDTDGELLGVGSVSTDITERKRMEMALRESEARLQAIVDQSPAAIVLRDHAGRFILANREYLRRTKKRVEEVLGQTLAEVESEAVAREVADQDRRVLEARRPQMFDVTRSYPDGGEMRVAVVRFAVPAADGSEPDIGAIGLDITEWKKAEEALKESESRLQAIMEHSPAAIVLRDLEGRFLVVNREYLRRTGKSVSDVLGRTLGEVEAEALAKEIQAQEREMLESGQSRMFQAKRISPAGDERTSAVMRFPVPAADGTVRAVGAISIDITEWKKAEEALQQSEARLRAIMEHSPAAIFLKDRESRFLVANREYLRRRGMESEEILGRTTLEVNTEEVGREIWLQEQEVMASGTPAMYRVSRSFVPGQELTLAIMRFPILAPSGEVDGVGGISIDVTRERQAEVALRENEEKLRLVLHSTGEGIYAVDLQGRSTLCNPAAARILGYDDPEELLGCDVHALIHHSRADGTPYPHDECRIHRAMSVGELVHADDEVFWRRDGRPVPVELRSNPVRRDGTIVGTVVSFADISERKRVEAWLLRLSQAVEQGPFGVIITDEEGRIEYANPGFLRETGYTAEELRGKSAAIQNADDPDSQSDREIEKALSEGREWRGEARHRRKNGEIYWASLLISPIRDKDDRTVAFVSISEDISERRRMAEHLRQAQKMEAVGQLTGGIAHDFNNILSVILTSAECLADDLAGQAEMGSLVATIVRAVHRAAGLTERLLAFSRRQDLSPEVTDLAAVTHEMADMLRRSLGETIAVTVRAEADVPPVVVDRGQFENALLNLAVNARDAMPQGGALSVGVARGAPPGTAGRDETGSRDFVCVTVTDTGTGMPPEVTERAFEPFFTTKAKGQGTGLGLSMVYGFVRQSGGDILLDSAEGKGTSFRLYFPAAEGLIGADGAAEQKPAENDGVLPPLIVVLAEDDPGVRSATKFILENVGHRVHDAGTGADALEILKRLPRVDLLLTDVIMPGGMSGRDLAEAAHAIDPHLKILFTSGYADGRLSMGDIVPGTTAFVPKPYTKESLIGALRALWFSPRGKGGRAGG